MRPYHHFLGMTGGMTGQIWRWGLWRQRLQLLIRASPAKAYI